MQNITEHARAKKLSAFFDSLTEEKNGFYSLTELLQYKLLVVQKHRGSIVGISGVLPRNVLFLRLVPKNLFFIVVRNDFQNLGLGQKMARKVIRTAMRRNYGYLALYVRRTNGKAIHIYLKLGFRKVYSPFMGAIDFMILPLSFLGWFFLPLLHIYFFFVPLKGLIRTIYNLFSK